MSATVSPWAARLRRWERILVDTLFVLLLLGLIIGLGWLSTRHDRYWDWTRSADNSLSELTLAVLERLEDPLLVSVFTTPHTPLAQAIERRLTPYRQALPRMQLRFIDPRLHPELARESEVALVGQVVLDYQGRRERLNQLDERSIAAAIARLTAPRGRWVAALEGHDERAIDGSASFDLGRFAMELGDQGFLVRTLDLTQVPAVPDNLELLLLSTPRLTLFPEETAALIDYLEAGGNLLWLLDPGPLQGLEPLAEHLGLELLPGTVLDAEAARFGLDTPAVAVIGDYPPHPLTEGLREPALLFGSLAFEPHAALGWTLETYLASSPQSWNETGRLEGPIDRDEVVGERPGPLPVLLALTRPREPDGREQRVIVVGDGDFLSNRYLGEAGNRALGLRLLQWLGDASDMVELPPPPTPGEPIVLTPQQRLWLGLGALGGYPGILLTLWLLIRWRRGAMA